MAEIKCTVEQGTTLCKVYDKFGYFHAWEHYSKPMIGGPPDGVFSKIFGIVEFANGVRRVDPTDINFCDDENEALKELDKTKKGEN